MKKIFSVILSVVFIFAFSSVANAQITKDQYYARSFLGGEELKLYDDCYNEILNNNPGYQIDGYDLSDERIGQIVNYVFNDAPELFCIRDGMYTDEEVVDLNAQLKQRSDEILGLIDVNMSDVDKFKVIYAYLGEHVEYDYSVAMNKRTTDEGKQIAECWTIVGGLINNKAICTGMAATLQYILYQLDIPCYSVSGSNHVWNIVNLDGSWYITDLSRYSEIKAMMQYNRILMNENYYQWYNVDPDEYNPDLPTQYSSIFLTTLPTYEKPTPAHTQEPTEHTPSTYKDVVSQRLGEKVAPTPENAPEAAQEPESNPDNTLWYILGCAAIAVVALVVILVARRKKKQ